MAAERASLARYMARAAAIGPDPDFSGTPPATTEQRFVAAMGLLDRAVVTLSAFGGLLMEKSYDAAATGGDSWRSASKRLERALLMTNLLRVAISLALPDNEPYLMCCWRSPTVPSLIDAISHGALQMTNLLRVAISLAPFDNEPYLDMLLEIADSSITYRTRYLTALRAEYTLELLLADETNPRSVAFQFGTLFEHIGTLPLRDASGGEPLEHSAAARALMAIREADMEDLATRDANGDMHGLDDLLKQLKTDLYDISDALSARYFSHLTPSRLTWL